MSGGGSSGRVGFPGYIEDIHSVWLTGYHPDASEYDTESNYDLASTLYDVMDNALDTGGNPFTGSSLTDPSSDFSAVQTRFDKFETEVEALDPVADWQNHLTEVVEQIDECGVLHDIDIQNIIHQAIYGSTDELDEAIDQAVNAVSDSVIQDVVDATSAVRQAAKEKALRNFDGAMADLNAVHGSAFIIGRALIETQEQLNEDQLAAQLTGEQYQAAMQMHVELFRTSLQGALENALRAKITRDSLVDASTKLLAQSLNNKVSAEQTATNTLAETKRLEIVGTQEYESAEIDLDHRSALWDFEVFERGMNILAAPSGMAARLPPENSKAQSTIGGAMQGAAMGASLGSVVPGLGTAAGAGIGAVAGGLSGLLG